MNIRTRLKLQCSEHVLMLLCLMQLKYLNVMPIYLNLWEHTVCMYVGCCIISGQCHSADILNTYRNIAKHDGDVNLDPINISDGLEFQIWQSCQQYCVQGLRGSPTEITICLGLVVYKACSIVYFFHHTIQLRSLYEHSAAQDHLWYIFL